MKTLSPAKMIIYRTIISNYLNWGDSTAGRDVDAVDTKLSEHGALKLLTELLLLRDGSLLQLVPVLFVLAVRS